MSKHQLIKAMTISLCMGSLCLAQSLVPLDPGSVSDGHVYLLEDENDSSQNGNTGNLIGAPQIVDGLSGKAMQFNGADDGVHLPDAATINTSIHQNKTVIAVFNCADVSKTEKQMVYEEGGTTRGLNIYVHEGLAYAGGWNPADYTPQWPGTFISAPIGSNEWHVVVAVIRGGGAGEEADKFEMWLDGTLIGKGPGAQLNARADDNGIAHVVGQSKAHDGNITGGGSFFEGIVDEVWILNTALTEAELASIGPSQGAAKKPVPDDGEMDVLRDNSVSWTPGKYAVTHNLYFGDSFDDVNTATTPLAVPDANTFDPGRLEFGKTYFWRVDEVNGAPDNTVFKGDVWSFEAEPYSIKIPFEAITVTASSVNDDTTEPNRTIDGSGLDNPNDMNGLHSTAASDVMWMSAVGDPAPSLMYEFDSAQKLDQVLIWNSNHSSEAVIGWGIKDLDIQVSMDGIDWVSIPDVGPIAQGTGLAPSEAQAVDMGLALARYVKLNILTNWGGLLPQFGVAEVQFYSLPTLARSPIPASGSTDVLPSTVVSWRAGREASQHTVYVSTDVNAVADGTAPPASSPTNSLDLTALDLQLEETYYWRVDEVNDTEDPSLWAGPAWNLSTVPHLTVDDFESYGNISPDRPFQTWLDGFGYSPDEFFPVDYSGNGTGAGIGHDIWSVSSPHFDGDIMETTNTIAGSSQSMPFYFNGASETERALAMDFTLGGAQTLSIPFRGQAGNTGTLYVKINGVKVPYPRDAANLAKAVWQVFNIDLASVNTNLTNVTKLAIGVEGNASGMILIDDITLHAEAAQVITPVQPDNTGLVLHYKFDEGAGSSISDSSGQGNAGTFESIPMWGTGVSGSAVTLDGIASHISAPAAAWDTVSTQLTVSFWVKGDADLANNWVFFAGDGANRIVSCHLPWGGEVIFDTTLDWANERVIVGAASDELTEQWRHWTMLRNTDTGEKQVYIDGVLFGSTTPAIDPDTEVATPISGIVDFFIGVGNGGSDPYKGMIDDFKIYNRALSAEEILWQAGTTTPIDKPF